MPDFGDFFLLSTQRDSRPKATLKNLLSGIVLPFLPDGRKKKENNTGKNCRIGKIEISRPSHRTRMNNLVLKDLVFPIIGIFE
jgi:hypothetical protein